MMDAGPVPTVHGTTASPAGSSTWKWWSRNSTAWALGLAERQQQCTAVGQLGPCHLVRDKMKRYKKWGDWLKEAKSEMAILAITANSQKVACIRSCAGAPQEAAVKRVRIPSRVKEEEDGLSSDPEERWTTEQLEDLLSVL